MSIAYEHIPMALQFKADAAAFKADVGCVMWTDDAAHVLNWIHDQAAKTAKVTKDLEGLHLPFVTLWVRLQIVQPEWISLSRDLGIKQIQKVPKSATIGFAPAASINQDELIDTVACWIDGPLTHFVGKYGADFLGVERLRTLVKTKRLLNFDVRPVQFFPWDAAPTGTNPYEVTPGEIARILAGHEIFPGLGPVVRIIDAPTNSAELMTQPVEGAGGLFSLVCSIALHTLPGSVEPMLVFNFSRRRWADTLIDNPFRAKRVGGYALSTRTHPKLAFRFDLDYKSQGWTTNNAYTELENGLGLAPNFTDANIVNYPALNDSRVLVLHFAKVTDAKRSKLKSGVPLADRLAAFKNILELLSEKGFSPLANFKEIVRKAPSMPRISVLRSPIVLSHLLELTGADNEEDNDGDVDSDEYFPDIHEIDHEVVKLTKRSLSEWFGKDTPALDRRYGNLAGVVSDLVKSCGVTSDNVRRKLYVLIGSHYEKRWIETIVRMMLGDSVDLQVAELPYGVHGHHSQLPNSDSSPAVRMQARKDAWAAFTKGNQFGPHPMFLIQASEWYEDADGKRMHDDHVNKPAARRALAAELGATVQYLLPARVGKLDNYLMRLQAAILDLLYGHAGCMLGLAQATAVAFPKTGDRPTQTVAIGAVSITMGEKVGTVFAALRVAINSGRPQIKLAHMEAEPIYTDWMRFEDALSYVAKRSRLHIPDQKSAPAFFQRFVGQVCDDTASIDPHAVIFIESTHSAKYWKRLVDKQARFGAQALDAEQQPRNAWACLRIIRIRDQAPTMVSERNHGIKGGSEEPLIVATSVQRLYSVSGATAPTYWSYGPPMGQQKRGVSCYRPVNLYDSRMGTTKLFAADYGQHQTPRGTEFVVLQAQPGDDVDRLASYCELLRLGVPQARGDIWVKVPSPLYAIEKLAEYMHY